MLHTGELIECLQAFEKMNGGHALINKVDWTYNGFVLYTFVRGAHGELIHYVYNKYTKTFTVYEDGDWRRKARKE